ncbi:CheC, inhibitor of MCP methylation / FliN fusion protein [Desulfotomaculum nigrificans CO-1-SRB]|uniref:CheC, inhibitor of MCP methylation / FliN fusion protein n=1 Tax=Desulfotomaculum nigrificans (strain DSM 14880 / VKM B-2319 / CO-1-SRB) TaxID=868595 RepID=F6B7X9_DESCC|nr:flagellar motor switch phosphatase FliY [Desulfotomaculum nigrificans]AEF94616.1 CheC, inhibitor of MCP methylation / FliN fusion protein [Desulfotomaculum nigrificans CO-1-SRB]
MSNLLSQEEIDALMRGQLLNNANQPEQGSNQATLPPDSGEMSTLLTDEEKDALGEIGNISMGSASTTLSELLNQKVSITSPRVRVMTKTELFDSFEVPYLVIKVDFSEGLNGYNLLIIRLSDAAVMASLMMGGDGTPMSEEISELEISAAAEAMNMMIGTAATSLSQMFHRPINISPPQTNILKTKSDPLIHPPEQIEETVVVVSFSLKIGDLVDTDIMQIMGVETAKEEANLLLMDIMGLAQDETPAPETAPAGAANANPVSPPVGNMAETPAPTAPMPTSPGIAGFSGEETFRPQNLGSLEQRNLELILDIPLKVSVVLGRTKRPIKDVLRIAPGSVVELDSLADEPVEILVNGTLVATGEVVVVNENFGVRITNIISPMERIKRLGR